MAAMLTVSTAPDEFLEEILVLPDYLDVTVHGAPPLRVRYRELG